MKRDFYEETTERRLSLEKGVDLSKETRSELRENESATCAAPTLNQDDGALGKTAPAEDSNTSSVGESSLPTRDLGSRKNAGLKKPLWARAALFVLRAIKWALAISIVLVWILTVALSFVVVGLFPLYAIVAIFGIAVSILGDNVLTQILAVLGVILGWLFYWSAGPRWCELSWIPIVRWSWERASVALDSLD